MRFVVPIVAAALLGCASTASSTTAAVVPDPLRIENADDVSPESLGLVRGTTTLAHARDSMRSRGITGIVDDTFASAGSPWVSVLAADYQSHLHLFDHDRYAGSLAVARSGDVPYAYAVRIAAHRGTLYVLALYNDPRSWTSHADDASGPRITVFVRRGGRFERSGRKSLTKIARAHGGPTRPLFVGYDLEDGVLMVARDGQGAIWRDAYFVRLHEPPYAGAGRARLRLERVALEDAWRCDCVARYVGGASPESLWQ